jgi:hypothetical protein
MAYGSFYDFSLSGLFSSIDASAIVWAIIFLIFVAAINYSLSRVFRNNRAIPPVLAILVSLMAVYFLAQSGWMENFILNISFIEIEKYLPWIFLVVSALIIWKLGWGMLFMVIGLFLAVLGLLNISERNGLALMIGAIFFLIGLKLFLRRRKLRKLRGLNEKDKEELRERWRRERANTNKKWFNTGKKIGRWGAKKYYGAIGNLGGFEYEAGMRRGGKKGTRSRFVSRASTERYARRFGKWNARRRFKK